MKIRPIYTEKSMNEAKRGTYSFWVLPGLSKTQIKSEIEKAFDVKVASVKTLNYKKETKRNFRGRTITKAAKKKALIVLKSGKIELFEETKK